MMGTHAYVTFKTEVLQYITLCVAWSEENASVVFYLGLEVWLNQLFLRMKITRTEMFLNPNVTRYVNK